MKDYELQIREDNKSRQKIKALRLPNEQCDQLISDADSAIDLE